MGRYQRAVQRAKNIEELRRIARQRLPDFIFEFLERGAEDELTLQRNRAIFSELLWQPDTLINVRHRTLSTELFGRPLAAPIVIGPTGRNGVLWHQADQALARAAASAGIAFTLSTPSMVPLEEIASENHTARLWMQIYLSSGREYAKTLVKRSLAAGYEALVVTTDTPVSGNREWRYNRSKENTLVSDTLNGRQWWNTLLHPHWWSNVMWPHGLPHYTHMQPQKRSDALTEPTMHWEDIRELRRLWPRTLIVKGIMSAKDAVHAVEVGADGIVLSNHGGRQLDSILTPLEVLPEVADAVGHQIAVLIDSGFRRGSDIAKAIALGADAVLLGRATLYGVATAGQHGAQRALHLLITELDRILAFLGCTDIHALGRHHLRHSQILKNFQSITQE